MYRAASGSGVFLGKASAFMHIHILGICGTFMGGVARLAAAAGHKVTGSDANVYPPMSDQLRDAGINVTQGYNAQDVSIAPDLWVIGNAIGRGNPLLEEILDRRLPYTSGPQWLSENVLRDRHVLAVAGTHGKTTTSSMLLHILSSAGLKPGWLIGGVPFETHASAGLGESKYFVIEADEYDTAFFDKRSKFVHYRPMTAVLNNLEYDHADIFENLAAIEKQFHHLVRTIPRTGLVVANAQSDALKRALAMGCWSRVEHFNSASGWNVGEDRTVRLGATVLGSLSEMPAAGAHNASNALAAIAAANDVGVDPGKAIEAMKTFAGVARRLEVKGVEAGVTVIDDFAHHPSAIEATIAALRSKIGANGRILAVFEPRSNTMKLGTMKDRLADSLKRADRVFCYKGTGVNWDPAGALLPLGGKASTFAGEIDALAERVANEARSGDTVLCMSNGSFGGICGKILEQLTRKDGAR